MTGEIRDVTLLYVNVGFDGFSSVIKDNATGEIIVIPGGPITEGRVLEDEGQGGEQQPEGDEVDPGNDDAERGDSEADRSQDPEEQVDSERHALEPTQSGGCSHLDEDE